MTYVFDLVFVGGELPAAVQGVALQAVPGADEEVAAAGGEEEAGGDGALAARRRLIHLAPQGNEGRELARIVTYL